jgi:hypothetical protein
LGVVAAALLILGTARGWWTQVASPNPPSRDSAYAVLSDLEGNAEADVREAVAFLLRTGLDLAGVLQTVPEPDVRRVLGLMDRSEDEPLDPPAAREVALRLGVPTLVTARLDHVGQHYALNVRVEATSSGVALAAAYGSTDTDAGVVGMVEEVRKSVLTDLGGSASSLARTPPLPEVLTPSLEALRHYLRGVELSGLGNGRPAARSLREAVTVDTAFAMAWSSLANVYVTQLDQPDSGAWARDQVRRFPERLTAARRADLELHYRMRTDVAWWDEALVANAKAVTDDPQYLANHASYLEVPAGMPDSALGLLKTSILNWEQRTRRFDPLHPMVRCWTNELTWSVATDRTSELRRFLDSLRVDVPPECATEWELYERIAAGRWDEADRILAAGPEVWPWPLPFEAATRQLDAVRGRISAVHQEVSPERRPQTAACCFRTVANITGLLLEVVYGVAPHPDTSALTDRGWHAVEGYVFRGVRAGLAGDTAESKQINHRLGLMRDSATSHTFERAFRIWLALLDVGRLRDVEIGHTSSRFWSPLRSRCQSRVSATSEATTT